MRCLHERVLHLEIVEDGWMSLQIGNMDHLPDEILYMVFQYLTTPELLKVCARVNRRWKCVVQMFALELRRDGDEQRLHGGIRAVLLTTYPVDLGATLTDIITKARLLRELTVHSHAPLYDTHLSALQQLQHLVHLDVFTRPRHLDERLAPLLKRLHTLVVNETIKPGLLRQLAAGSQLVALHMFGRAVHFPRHELLALLRERAPYLQELTLRCNELPDAAYEVIGDCSALRELRLYSCWLLTAAGAGALCRPPHVRVLHVTGARLVRSHALADMLAGLQSGLRELVLSSGWFGDEHVRLLARSAPALRLFEVWHCKLSLGGVEALAKSLPCLERLEVDMILAWGQLRELARHPTLREVHCVQFMPELHEWYIDGLRVVETQARYARKYFRPGGEGFRSALFYFWTRDVPLPLKPMPAHMMPSFESCP